MLALAISKEKKNLVLQCCYFDFFAHDNFLPDLKMTYVKIVDISAHIQRHLPLLSSFLFKILKGVESISVSLPINTKVAQPLSH